MKIDKILKTIVCEKHGEVFYVEKCMACDSHERIRITELEQKLKYAYQTIDKLRGQVEENLPRIAKVCQECCKERCDSSCREWR